PIYEPYYNDTDLSLINLSAISRVTVSKGYASAEYGANTLGGAINLITGKVPDKTKLKINLSYGGNNSIYSDILFLKRFNKLHLTFGINYGESDGFSLSKQYEKQINEDGNLRENSDFNKLGTLLRVGYDPKQNLNFTFSHYYINSNKGIPFDEQAEKAESKYFWEPRYWRFSNYIKSIYSIDFKYFNEFFEVKEKVYYIKTDNTLDMFIDKDFSLLAEADTFDDYTMGQKLTFIFYSENDSEFSFGFSSKKDFHKKIADSKYYDEIEYDEISQDIFTFFAETRTYYFNKKLYIQLGMNYDSLNSGNYKVYEEGDTDIQAVDGRKIYSYNPNLMMTIKLRENFYSGFSIQKKTHYPTMSQMANNLDLGLDISEILPEQAVNKEVFMKLNLDKLDMKISLYDYNITNLIERAGKGFPFFNLQSAQINGAELMFKFKPNPKFNMGIGYSYIDSKSTTTPGNPGDYIRELPYVPRSSIIANLKFIYFLETDLNIRYQEKAFEYFNIADWGDPDEWVKEEITAFTLIDLKLQKEFFNKYKGYIIIKNILDVNYYQQSYYPAPGLSWQLGMSFEF
ncbi:TonB-dependent receptor, partial [Candidatus Dependentiae bacterium]|nr:TonB-dependent receptor [Candidatus Dependentiae bacterium]